MKNKYLMTILLFSSLILGQEDISKNLDTAVIKFQSTGINDMENQAFFEYFLQELKNASGNNFIDQKKVNQNTKSLGLTTSSCFTNECLTEAMDSTSSEVLIAGSIQFSKNKFRVKVHKVESTKNNKSKSYNIRYKGEVDGFITELQILAWEIIGENPPATLSDKRKPNNESFLENPNNKRLLVFTIAGLAGASYLSNIAGYNKSIDGSKIDPQAYNDHISSANKSKNEANLSLVVMITSIVYAYYDGLLNFGNK
jgi:hypothetical protein